MIYLGADHGGFELKEKMKKWLSEWKLDSEDCGALSVDPDDDYTDYAQTVTRKVLKNPQENKGILICRSGGGMVIASNRFSGSRAVFIFNEQSAIHARKDNDANIACLAADWIDENSAKESLFVFLHTPFSNKERHARRIAKLELI